MLRKPATVAGLSMAKMRDRLSRALHPQGRNAVEDGKRPVYCFARNGTKTLKGPGDETGKRAVAAIGDGINDWPCEERQRWNAARTKRP
ncbi:hypothetical protein C8024_17265 [Sphingopyxis sp. BSNA05]|nr:hypothetical protein [Sphingopyxis sp. BSNA05]